MPEVRKEIALEIAHVLFIDIVGYSKLSINDQKAAVAELNQIVRASEHFQRAEKGGRLLKIATGDGMALVFYTSPEAPAQCAVEISRELQKHHLASKDKPQLSLRMGIHSGPVSGVVDVNDRPNLAGAGLNIAQRVMNCADAGHILVSKHVAEDLEEYQRWRPLLHDLGTCEMKHGLRVGVFNLYSDDVGNPTLPKKFQAQKKHRSHVRWAEAISAFIVLLAVVIAFIFAIRRPTRSAGFVPEKSIAVLPFANLSRDPENAYFADGIQEEILTRLCKIADLKVISRTSTQHYKTAPTNLPDIAQQLGVAHILEGSVQKSGDAVRVNVQLVRAANDSHLWADTFDRKLTDTFSVETEVAKAIAEQLRVKLTGREEQELASKPTSNPEAYDAYLRGLALTQKSLDTTATMVAAQESFRTAVRLDPKFALAWAKLSYCDSYAYIGNISTNLNVREEARQAADTALDLQPGLGEALLAKGYYNYWCLKAYDTAVRYFEQAAQAFPNSSEIPAALAYVARRRGAWEESDAHFNEAERLDPRNVDVLAQHALLLWSLRRFQEATQKIDQILKIIPDDPDMLALQASIAQGEGDLPRAARLLRPLHPTVTETRVLETQIAQATLERRPAEMIARLKEILASPFPDPALATLNAELRFDLGWLQQLDGDNAAAQASWQQARRSLEAILPQQPDDTVLLADLALAAAAQMDKTAALGFAERVTSLVPIEKDALIGASRLETLARVCAQVGEPDRAMALLQRLLSMPYEAPITPALLRLDPMFDPLRNDPRFQKLAESEAPK